MSRNLPPLNALRAFEAAARLESFSLAADELNVSHSAISRHVRGLEKRLDVQLFAVANRGVALTDMGRQYAALVTPALDQIAVATEQVSSRVAGAVVVSAEPTIAQKWLVPRLGAFQDLYPDVDVQLESSTEVRDVGSHAVDVALRYCADTTRTEGFELVSDRPFYPYAAPGFAGLDLESLTPEVMATRWLIGDYITKLWPMWFQAAGVSDLPTLKITRPMQTLLTIEYAVAGQGILLLSSELVAPEVRDGKLVRLSDVCVACGGYYLVTNEAAARRRAVRLFREWLLEESLPLREG